MAAAVYIRDPSPLKQQSKKPSINTGYAKKILRAKRVRKNGPNSLEEGKHN